MLSPNKLRTLAVSTILMIFGYFCLYIFLQNFGSKKIQHYYPYFSSGLVILVSYLSVFYVRNISKDIKVKMIIYIFTGVILGIIMLILNLFWEQFIIDVYSVSLYANVIDKKTIILRSLKGIFFDSYFYFPIWMITLAYGVLIEIIFVKFKNIFCSNLS